MTSPRNPSITEVLSQALDERAAQLLVCLPGEVVSFNRNRQVAEVRPVILKRDGSSRATTVETPVIFPGIYWDVQEGEYGLLLVSDEDWRAWWRTGDDAQPESEASHELSSSFFLPGLVPNTAPRTLGGNFDKVIDKIGAGNVIIGDPTANKAALHEDLLSALDSFFTDLATWVTQVDVAAGPLGGTAALQAEITALKAGIAAGSYESPSVFVED